MSEMRIKDGSGKANTAKVDDELRLYTHAVSVSNAAHHSSQGSYHNVNTGVVNLTDGTESAVIYIKYTGTKTFKLSTFILGVGTLGGTVSDSVKVTMVRNPTTGTIIDNAVDVDINENLNFASANELSVDAYKGVQGDTITNGDDVAIFFGSGSQRLAAPLDFTLPQGTSIGINVQLNATSGGNIYIALNGFEEDL